MECMLNIVRNNVSPTEVRSAWMRKCHVDHGWSRATAPLAKCLQHSLNQFVFIYQKSDTKKP